MMAPLPVIFFLLSFPGLSTVFAGQCRLPSGWEGTWFQSGVAHHVLVNRTAVSTKGRCLESSGDKFLFEDRNDKLHRCVVMHERHANVLQYKETFSDRGESLETLCSHISGDAPLYSMFRAGAVPVTCPLKAPFQFTYFRGDNRECKSPVSSIDSCTDDSRLLFRFQACPDVINSESTVEELTCLATWKEGSVRYLVGKLEHKMATSDEDKYRCFVYEKNKEREHIPLHLAQSGDATCNGLATIEGARTLVLSRGTHQMSKCLYPHWVTNTHRWHSLDSMHSFNFGRRNNSLHITNLSSSTETRVACVEEVPNASPDVATFITHMTTGCKIGFACLAFYRRAQHVVEVQRGNFADNREEACQPQFFSRSIAPYFTLTTPTPQARQCPPLSKYNLVWDKRRIARSDTCIEGVSSLRIGCRSTDTLELHLECPSDRKVEAYECHANWEENGTHYLITSIKGTLEHYCFVYWENEQVLQFQTVQDSCQRNVHPGVAGLKAFNVTSDGHCSDDASNSASSLPWVSIMVLCALLSIGSMIVVG